MVNSEQLEKIARMALYDVPYKQIAHAVSLTEAEIITIMEGEEYKELLDTLSTDHFEKYNSLNDGWDMAEAVALKGVLDHLEWAKDPDFALKVATMANRATRRGQVNNRVIDGQAGVRAVIHLSAQFVDKLQINNNNVNGHQVNGNVNGGPRLALRNRNERVDPRLKDSDSMSPDEVEKIFAKSVGKNKEVKNDEDLLGFLPAMLPAE